MDEQPGEPGKEAGEAQAGDVGDRLLAADGGHVALVEVAEGGRGRSAVEAVME
ncbi:MAG: hypothetical protein GY773_18395, partial [Actinomycetia bacterium]|nr:hypothetical protein [Actinomycetes bacterium]